MQTPATRPGDALADVSPDGRWMTLAELGQARGINKASAARLVRRHRWRRQADNQGRVRVLVPPDAIEPHADSPADSPADLSNAISALQGALASVEKRAESAESRAKQAESRAESAENDRRAAESRAESANARAEVAESRQRWAEDRVEGLRDLLTETERSAADAEDGRKAALAHADALDRAEFERQGRGLVARLRAAWRGM